MVMTNEWIFTVNKKHMATLFATVQTRPTQSTWLINICLLYIIIARSYGWYAKILHEGTLMPKAECLSSVCQKMEMVDNAYEEDHWRQRTAKYNQIQTQLTKYSWKRKLGNKTDASLTLPLMELYGQYKMAHPWAVNITIMLQSINNKLLINNLLKAIYDRNSLIKKPYLYFGLYVKGLM